MVLRLVDFRFPDLGRLLARQSRCPVFEGPSQVRAYWEALRGAGSIPDRAQLDPRGLSGVLDRVFLAESIGWGMVQVRIAGSAIAEAAGTDLRGLPLSFLFSANARPQLAEALEPVITGQAVAELDLGGGSAGQIGQLLLLPLSDGPDRRLVLGCLGHAEAALRPGRKLDVLCRREEQIYPNMPAAPPNQKRQVGHLTLIHARD
ncbi:PAS domain-containing protein [Tabrizicola sp.]|uniref:PAS domain-containing protein n=1 Tax=Tabrizicola sp. TaxID=2005166 RepID=UPI0026318479|nr:PAS domain-containing protein [Tabrizicola sp.]MDM7930867.1 PAS domain-containing protein [Tabrizicola sp.]